MSKVLLARTQHPGAVAAMAQALQDLVTGELQQLANRCLLTSPADMSGDV